MPALRRRLTYANVTASLALFIALGGGAYAAVTLPKNSVGAAQLKKNSVSSTKVKDRSLLKKDFKTGQLPAGPKGDTGAPGAKGDKGDKGDTGQVPAQAPPTTITSFQNSWSAYDSGTPATTDDTPARFWKDFGGVVHLEGAVTHVAGVGDGSVIFQLPEGFRPAANYLNFAVVTTGFSDFNEVLGMLDIGNDGNVFYEGGNPEYFSLDGVTFRAAP